MILVLLLSDWSGSQKSKCRKPGKTPTYALSCIESTLKKISRLFWRAFRFVRNRTHDEKK